MSKTYTDELWEKYFNNKTPEIKNQLVLEYVYLVKKIVYRMMPTYERYISFDEMLSDGILGLMDAINKYDLSKKVKFEHYATLRIKGEIVDQIRKQDWAPSSLRRKIKAINTAYSDLENKLFRMPSDREVAAHLGMKEEELQKTMEKSHVFNILHFEEMVTENYQSIGNLPDKQESTEQQVEKKEMKVLLGNMIDSLPEKEKLVITLYYFEEMTLKEIAGVLGVTESRISQIHSKVLIKLRTKMKSVLT